MLICPVCKVPLCGVEYEGMRVHVCPDCGGALVPSLRLGVIRRRRERRWTRIQRRILAERALARDRLEPIRCPRCLMPMAKQAVALGEGNFHLDRCDPCAVWWFDGGELEVAQILFEQDEGRRPPPEGPEGWTPASPAGVPPPWTASAAVSILQEVAEGAQAEPAGRRRGVLWALLVGLILLAVALGVWRVLSR